MASAQLSMPRRLVSWVWDTNHDDQVPTVIHGVLVSVMITALPFAAGSVLCAFGIIALLAAPAVGTAFAGMSDQDSLDDVPRASVVSADRAMSRQRDAGSPTPADCECHPAYHELGVHAPGWVAPGKHATDGNLTSLRISSKVCSVGAEVENEEKV